MSSSRYENLKIQTYNTALLWKDVFGLAPNEAALKLNRAMLNWQSELTNTLKIWIDKGIDMSEGELILAYANLGAVVESWLKFFFCVYYDDYCKEPFKDKKGKMVEPENMSFENLQNFSTGKLWDSESSKEYLWVKNIRYKRNAIHSFKYKNIGTAYDFICDVDYLFDFVDNILSHVPSIEDHIDSYPVGYIFNANNTNDFID